MPTCLPRQRFRSCPSSSRKLKSRGLGLRHPNKSVLLLKSTSCVSVHMDVNKNDKIYTNTLIVVTKTHFPCSINGLNGCFTCTHLFCRSVLGAADLYTDQ